MLRRLIAYNSYDVKISFYDICNLCKSYDLLFLEETWLSNDELTYCVINEVILKTSVPQQWMFQTTYFLVEFMVRLLLNELISMVTNQNKENPFFSKTLLFYVFHCN